MIRWLIARLFKMERGLGHSPLLHPFLAGFYPILGLFSLNADQLWTGMLVGPLLASAAASALLLGIARWGPRPVGAGGLHGVDPLGALLRPGLRRRRPQAVRAERAVDPPVGVILPAAVLSTGAWWWLGRRGEMRDPTLFANIAVLVLLLFPLVRIGAKLAARERRGAEESVASVAADAAGPRRDVYYIILGRVRAGRRLEGAFQVRQRALLEGAREAGFRVLPQSRSNYAFTALSLASSLNMEYLDGLAAREGKESVSFQVCKEMIQDSRLQSFFKERGYTTVHFKTGWAINDDNPRADVQVGGAGLIEFNAILLRSSAVGVFMEARLENDYRELILNNLTMLASWPAAPAPSTSSPTSSPPTRPTSSTGRGATPWRTTARRPTRTAGRSGPATRPAALPERPGAPGHRPDPARSKVPPIIVLQSDHGSASLGFWRRPPPAVAFERMSDFCALSLPGFRGDIPPTSRT